MYLLKGIIDILIILFLLRLLIRANEAFFNPIYRMIYRITDPVLIPAGYVTRRPNQGVLLTLAALVVLRGIAYVFMQPMPFLAALGASLLSLFQLLFQAYMVMWFVSILSQRSFGVPFNQLIQRAFIPVQTILARLGIPARRFNLSAFVLLLVAYALLSTLVRHMMVSMSTFSALSIVYAFAEGIMLFLNLFPFPGFFSLVIVAGALLSWVSPDPTNPIVQAIYGISEPLLAPFRRFVPLLGGIDLSPLVALFCFHIGAVMGQQIVSGLLRAL